MLTYVWLDEHFLFRFTLLHIVGLTSWLSHHLPAWPNRLSYLNDCSNDSLPGLLTMLFSPAIIDQTLESVQSGDDQLPSWLDAEEGLLIKVSLNDIYSHMDNHHTLLRLHMNPGQGIKVTFINAPFCIAITCNFIPLTTNGISTTDWPLLQ